MISSDIQDCAEHDSIAQLTDSSDIKQLAGSFGAKLTEVLLLLNGSANKIVILCEGDDDSAVYGKFFNFDYVYLCSFGTCDRLDEFLKETKNYSDMLFAIKDADFDYLNNKTFKFDNLFLTDAHDLETMMFDDEVKKQICLRYFGSLNTSKINQCVSDIKNYSFLRWYDNYKNLKINFKRIKITCLYNGQQKISVKECVDYLDNNGYKSLITEQELSCFIFQNSNVEELKLTNGHDLCNCISIYIKSQTKSQNNLNEEKISSILSAAYSFQKFQKTTLYADIQKWCNTNNHSNIFVS